MFYVLFQGRERSWWEYGGDVCVYPCPVCILFHRKNDHGDDDDICVSFSMERLLA